MPTLSGEDIALRIGHSPFTVGGRTGQAVTINGTVPAPLIRLREGQNVRIAVTNTLEEDTSIHWHGVLLPFQMDGVPGVSFPGRSEEHTSELPSLMSLSSAVLCLKKNNHEKHVTQNTPQHSTAD